MSVVYDSSGLEVGYPSELDPALENLEACGDMYATSPESGHVDACWQGVKMSLVLSIIASHGGRR